MTISEDSMNRLIREAFGELCSEEYRPHEEAEPIPVSFPFDLYMEELLDERAKRTIRFRKMGWISVILLLAAAMMIFSVILAKKQEMRWNAVEIVFPGESLPQPTERLPRVEHTYYIAGLPSGYKLTKKDQSEYAIREVWSDGTCTLERWQSCLSWRLWKDRRSRAEKNVYINGTEGRIHLLGDGSMLLLWSDKHYYMELKMSRIYKWSDADADRLVQWAEGLIQADLYEPEPDGMN
jgi:hypothetical protein